MASTERWSGSFGPPVDCAIWNIAACGSVNSLYGGAPVAISITVQPKLHISAGNPCPFCLITSGAIQYGVPMIDDNPAPVKFWNIFEHPKSANLMFGDCPTPTSKFAPLMSRWTMHGDW